MTEIASFLAAFARTAAWMHSAPLIGDPMVPPRLRVAAAALTASALAAARPAMTMDGLFAALPGELLLGLAAGFAVRLVLAGAEAGGQLVGLSLELGFAGSYDASQREEALPTRRIAHSLAGVAFLAAGGLEQAVRQLVRPAPPLMALMPWLRQLIQSGGQVTAAGLRLAAPMLLASLVTQVGLALTARAAPALNVFSVMLAVTLVVGALVLTGTSAGFAGELLSLARRAADGAGLR